MKSEEMRNLLKLHLLIRTSWKKNHRTNKGSESVALNWGVILPPRGQSPDTFLVVTKEGKGSVIGV